MTITNIISTACVLLQKDQLLECTELGGAETSTTAQVSELAFLLRCLNLAYNQVATDYIPLLKTETKTSVDGKITLSSLTETLLYVKKIVDNYGIRVSYKLYPNEIETIDGEIDITYSYQPDALSTLSSTMENFSGKLTERVMAYGVVMEYCFISGLHDDAQIWEKRFKDGLKIASRKKSEIRLPQRRWN